MLINNRVTTHQYSQGIVKLSSLSKEKVKEILEELGLAVIGNDSIPKLAKYLGLSKQTLYGWTESGKIPIESVKSKVKNVNPYFLKRGEGRPLLSKEDQSAIDSVNRVEEIVNVYKGAEPTKDDLLKQLELAESLIRNTRKLLKKMKSE